MKRLQIIAILLLIVLAACNSKKQVPEPVEGPSKELCAIDSLMWRQPDSALTVLMDYFDDDSRDAARHVSTTGTFENHYANLLLAELLFKNYAFQTNRTQLLEAVSYFDSLVRQAPPFKGAGGIKKDLTPNLVFLDARAHYINGVGYYEQDSVVPACKEYLKALEVMEDRFEEKTLTGKCAQFMANTYNRLGDLFSEQFMMESSISCYEKALIYCRIEPTSPNGISNILYRIGKQYDKENEIENARSYYSQALENMTVTDNMVYRDIVASKALCDYKVEGVEEYALDELNTILKLANTENERLNRYLTIGCVYFFDRNYDSALFYFEPVFANKEDVGLQTHAAVYLRFVYDSIGDVERSNNYMRFLTNQKKSDGDNKALVSKLEDLYKNYSNQKLEKQAEAERKIAEKRVMNTIIPIAIAVALAIFCVLIWRNRRQLKFQQKEADRALGEAEQEHEKELRLWQAEADKTLKETKKKYEEELRQLKAETEQQLEEVERKHQQWMAKTKERHEEELRVQQDKTTKEAEQTHKRHEAELEAERKAYQKEQEALRQSLRQREEQVNALETALVQQRKEAERRHEAFLKEPICQRILGQVRSKPITTRKNAFELGLVLKDDDFEQLGAAVEKHYSGFDHVLLSQCPSLKSGLLSLCHLHLLGLNESEIAALKNLSYSAIKKQNESLQEKLGVKDNVAKFVLRVTKGLCGNQIGPQIDAIDGTRRQKREKIWDKNDRLMQKSGMKNMKKSMQKIVMLISISPDITLLEMASQLGMSRNGVDKNIRKLKEQGIIRRVGPDKGGHWEVIG